MPVQEKMYINKADYYKIIFLFALPAAITLVAGGLFTSYPEISVILLLSSLLLYFILFLIIRSKLSKINFLPQSFYRIFDNSVDGVYVCSADGTLVYANDKLAQLLGYPSKKHLLSEFPRRSSFAGDDEDYKEFIDELFSSGQNERNVLDLKDKSGENIPVHESAFVLKGCNKGKTGWIGEISPLPDHENILFELKSSEILLATLINNSELLIGVSSPDGECLIANKALAEFFGIGSAELCLGRSYTDFLSPETADEFWNILQRACVGEAAVNYEMVIPDCRSRKKVFSVNLIPVQDAGGSLRGALFMARDVTASVEAHKRAQQSHEASKEVVTLKNQLVEQMSHELRTPLAGIAGAFEVLKSYCHSQEGISYAQKGIVSTRRLNEVIKEILSMSEDSGLDIVSTVNPVEIADSCREASLLYTEGRGIDLEFRYIDAPEAIYCKKKRLRLAFHRMSATILENFKTTGKALFILKKGSSFDVCNALEFYFCDINNYFSKYDYQMFFPDDFLGLAGTLDAECFIRNRDSGREIGFKIGCVNHSRCCDSDPEVENPASKRILIAEDDINSQARMRMQLEKLGYSVRAVSIGSEVLKCFEEDSFDLLLLDIQMPEMDGIEVLKHLRNVKSDYSDIPVICMSAYIEDGDNFIEKGADHFLSKPIETSKLKELLKLVFNRDD